MKTTGTLRFRLTVLAAGLFLVVGAAMLALTFVLIATTVPNDTPAQAIETQEVLVCQVQKTIASRSPAATLPTRINGKIPIQPAPPAQFCKRVLKDVAKIGATSERSSTLRRLLLYSILGLLGMTAVSAAAAWRLSGRALRPLRDITAAAGRASRSNLGERMDVDQPVGELKELADTFDGMLARLEASFAAQERFVADASHELRTPLAALRTVVDVNLGPRPPTADELTQLGHDARQLLTEADSIVDSLLLLSRSDAGMLGAEDLDLAGLVSAAVDSPLTIGYQVERNLKPAEVRGDRVLVERAVANLIDNAVVHNDERRWARVSTQTGDDEVVLTVENTGRVITRDQVDDLFRPFFRLGGRSGQGHGIGLAIVRSVAVAHGGRVEALPRPDGGLSVRLVVPRVPRESSATSNLISEATVDTAFLTKPAEEGDVTG